MPRAKTALFATVVILSNVGGNALLNAGVKGSSVAIGVLGVALLVLWALARMTLLSWADLSWVLPVTALGYPLSAAAGRVFFEEPVSAERWLGAVLVAAGAALAGARER
jgi:drug/metabolite transporter (DMT)-like permease